MKPSRMTDEVSAALALRHSAEQRGQFSPLGRLLWLDTDHGRIQFPAKDGEFDGPDLAQISKSDGESLPITYPEVLLVLGQWSGLPALRQNSHKFCPKCLHTCNVCGGKKKKLCEMCGGRKWTPGPWLPCPGADCNQETGNFKPECVTCRGSGQIPREMPCQMCDSTGEMTCTQCRGTGKWPTGRQGGSVDYQAPACKACEGNCRVGEWKKQDLRTFTNARLLEILERGKQKYPTREFLVLGPIYSFGLNLFGSRGAAIFDVVPDAKNDLLNLLVPADGKQKPQKAYLVGGIVRERDARGMSA